MRDFSEAARYKEATTITIFALRAIIHGSEAAKEDWLRQNGVDLGRFEGFASGDERIRAMNYEIAEISLRKAELLVGRLPPMIWTPVEE